MGRTVRRGTLTAAVALSAIAGVAAAQAIQSPADVWNRFYAGCATRDGQQYLCACAGTELIRRCQNRGHGDPREIAQCVATDGQTWDAEVTRLCSSFGHLRLGRNVPRPPARPIVGSGPPVPQLTLFDATFDSCRQAAPNDAVRDIACACVAEYTVEACAPHANVPAGHVEACGQAIGSEIERIFPRCRHFASLTTADGTAQPSNAAVPRAMPPPPPSNASQCQTLAGLTEPDQRTGCARIVRALEEDDLDAFLATIPRGGRVVLFGRPRQTARAVEMRVRQDSLSEMFAAPVTGSVVGDAGEPILVMVSQSRVDADHDWIPEATFRWDARNGRWALISLQEPPQE